MAHLKGVGLSGKGKEARDVGKEMVGPKVKREVGGKREGWRKRS